MKMEGISFRLSIEKIFPTEQIAEQLFSSNWCIWLVDMFEIIMAIEKYTIRFFHQYITTLFFTYYYSMCPI